MDEISVIMYEADEQRFSLFVDDGIEVAAATRFISSCLFEKLRIGLSSIPSTQGNKIGIHYSNLLSVSQNGYCNDTYKKHRRFLQYTFSAWSGLQYYEMFLRAKLVIDKETQAFFTVAKQDFQICTSQNLPLHYV